MTFPAVYVLYGIPVLVKKIKQLRCRPFLVYLVYFLLQACACNFAKQGTQSKVFFLCGFVMVSQDTFLAATGCTILFVHSARFSVRPCKNSKTKTQFKRFQASQALSIFKHLIHVIIMIRRVWYKWNCQIQYNKSMYQIIDFLLNFDTKLYSNYCGWWWYF